MTPEIRPKRTLTSPHHTHEGTIREASWDRDAWTLLVDVPDSGVRIVQVPTYGRTPRRGDRVNMLGRQPLLGIQIKGADVIDLGS